MQRAAIVLIAVLLVPLMAHAESSQESARKDLEESNIPYTTEEFIDRAKQGDSDAVKLFLVAGMYYNARDENRWTALMWAASRGHAETVQLLLDMGADVNARDFDGKTALMLADVKGFSDVVDILLQYGAKAYPPGDLLASALVNATNEYDIQAVRELLAQGADANSEDEGGNTVLIIAAINGQSDIARVLIDKGADANRKKRVVDVTPLMFAARNGHAQIVRLLLDAGADVNAKHRAGGTALIWAAANGHADIVRLLLSRGADVNARDMRGRTSLMFAAKSGHSDIVQILLQKGAVISLKDAKNSTALMYAESEGHPDIVFLLENFGLRRQKKEYDNTVDSDGEMNGEDREAAGKRSEHTTSFLIPDFNEAKRNIDIGKCADNMRRLGLALSRFAKEHRDIFPEVSNIKGNFIFAGDLIYPEYLREIGILGCPGDKGYDEKVSYRLKDNVEHPNSQIGDVHPDCITCESYIYLGWMLTNEKEGLAAIDAYVSVSSDELEKSLIVPDGYGNLNGNMIRRLTFGVDRFLITDINAVLNGKPSPASEIPVIWEWPSNHGNGGNVLYLDGHVEFVPYPGKFPMTERFVEALRETEPEFNEDVLPPTTR